MSGLTDECAAGESPEHYCPAPIYGDPTVILRTPLAAGQRPPTHAAPPSSSTLGVCFARSSTRDQRDKTPLARDLHVRQWDSTIDARYPLPPRPREPLTFPVAQDMLTLPLISIHVDALR